MCARVRTPALRTHITRTGELAPGCGCLHGRVYPRTYRRRETRVHAGVGRHSRAAVACDLAAAFDFSLYPNLRAVARFSFCRARASSQFPFTHLPTRTSQAVRAARSSTARGWVYIIAPTAAAIFSRRLSRRLAYIRPSPPIVMQYYWRLRRHTTQTHTHTQSHDATRKRAAALPCRTYPSAHGYRHGLRVFWHSYTLRRVPRRKRTHTHTHTYTCAHAHSAHSAQADSSEQARSAASRYSCENSICPALALWFNSGAVYVSRCALLPPLPGYLHSTTTRAFIDLTNWVNFLLCVRLL